MCITSRAARIEAIVRMAQLGGAKEAIDTFPVQTGGTIRKTIFRAVHESNKHESLKPSRYFVEFLTWMVQEGVHTDFIKHLEDVGKNKEAAQLATFARQSKLCLVTP